MEIILKRFKQRITNLKKRIKWSKNKSELLNLLPISPNAQLKTTKDKIIFLETYRDFIRLSVEALRAFSTKDLKKFDAHVGDTACQIRAYKFLRLTLLPAFQKIVSAYIKDYMKALNLIELVIKELKKLRQNEKKRMTVADLLAQNDLHLPLELNCGALICAFFLSKYTVFEDEKKLNSRIDIKKMQSDLPLSRQFVEKFVKLHQRILTKDSYVFLKKLSSSNSELIDIISDYQKYDSIHRTVLPTFLSGFIILQHILQKRGQLILISKNNKSKFILLYKTNRSKTDFEICKNLEQKPYFIIEGEVADNITTKKELETYLQVTGVLNVLLINFAAHPQYSCNALQDFNKNIFIDKDASRESGSKTLKKISVLFQFLNSLKEKKAPQDLSYCIKHIYSGKLEDNV